MNDLLRPARMELNLLNLAHNFREVKKLVKQRPVICSVKADAYGHGALSVSRVLEREGAAALGVATVKEAAVLREGGITAPIVCFSLIPDDLAAYVFEYDIVPVISGIKSAKALAATGMGKYGKEAKVMVAVDTGMGRVGFLPDEKALEDIRQISKIEGITITGIFSHFATSDDRDKTYAYEQLKIFNDFAGKMKLSGIDYGSKIIANSGACVDLPEAWIDGVRPGILLYGYMPSDEVINRNIDLRPVMSVKADIVHIKKVPEGTRISYGGTYVTEKEAVIATIPVGYADGYLRAFSNRAEVIVGGKRAKIAGRICMDQFMVDVTHIPDVKEGDTVTLLGQDGEKKIDADELAHIADTINYEIICGFGNRLEKIYIEE